MGGIQLLLTFSLFKLNSTGYEIGRTEALSQREAGTAVFLDGWQSVLIQESNSPAGVPSHLYQAFFPPFDTTASYSCKARSDRKQKRISILYTLT